MALAALVVFATSVARVFQCGVLGRTLEMVHWSALAFSMTGLFISGLTHRQKVERALTILAGAWVFGAILLLEVSWGSLVIFKGVPAEWLIFPGLLLAALMAALASWLVWYLCHWLFPLSKGPDRTTFASSHDRISDIHQRPVDKDRPK